MSDHDQHNIHYNYTYMYMYMHLSHVYAYSQVLLSGEDRHSVLLCAGMSQLPHFVM